MNYFDEQTLIMRSASILLLLCLCMSSGCGSPKLKPYEIPKTGISLEERLDVANEVQRRAEADALDLLAKSSNWRNIEKVSETQFRGEFHEYRKVRIVDVVDATTTINGRPLVNHIKIFRFYWRYRFVTWDEIPGCSLVLQGKTHIPYLEPEEGVRPVYGWLVVASNASPSADQSNGFIAAFEDLGDAKRFKDLLDTLRDIHGAIDEMNHELGLHSR